MLSARKYHLQNFADEKCLMDFIEWKNCNFKLSFLKCVPEGPNGDISEFIQVIAWHCIGNKPIYEPIMIQISDAI